MSSSPTSSGCNWSGTVRPHSAIGMHAPIEHEQAYTPPDDTDTADAQDVGEQTTINQPQPATTGAR
ncbi:Hypothetical protein AAM4_2573 [Actinomyces succiniciruminis]|uniref:Uncharacterized protein n=1 Tax=Actinomyces succiniciruminis TaxID=1522002 RepID=A0A1L7REB7_9ACTO|nr:Hypothetical protein AAM4_2573 [Actinomyces succiniciruminis]